MILLCNEKHFFWTICILSDKILRSQTLCTSFSIYRCATLSHWLIYEFAWHRHYVQQILEIWIYILVGWIFEYSDEAFIVCRWDIGISERKLRRQKQQKQAKTFLGDVLQRFKNLKKMYLHVSSSLLNDRGGRMSVYYLIVCMYVSTSSFKFEFC